MTTAFRPEGIGQPDAHLRSAETDPDDLAQGLVAEACAVGRGGRLRHGGGRPRSDPVHPGDRVAGKRWFDGTYANDEKGA
jgi:hypothetical protein